MEKYLGDFPLQVALLVLLYVLAVAALIRKYLLVPDRREDNIRLTSDSASRRQRDRGREGGELSKYWIF